ncbi:LLM class flavin-dependent oxidoreductase [Sphingomonas sp. SRS2]|uniref:LLM class flavin-dependent oxidoreductase n=1 Tax=Sphingomonas sp. SRS2 TaxID=133190 RepID=UPI0006184066|nr:LLM class flavin-dependent oxidoreductase [Sphingomonas sp. SRS2]KKC26014.1 monooxygenase [Sphingomonas sp. SRS2]
MTRSSQRMRFGAFIAPYHLLKENPTLAIERDLELIALLDKLDYDEAWMGEHHSAGTELIGSPEVFLAAAAERTKHIRLGAGVASLTFHHPLIVADRFSQLDHQTRGRIILGAGPGQLPSDASMMGIKSTDQRRMMVESLESIIQLLEGEVVSRDTDWFKLREAQLHLRPYQTPRMEIAVAASVTPSGPALAGRLGLSMLSLAASSVAGYSALPEHWHICESEAAKHGQHVSRDRWRVAAPMHIAPTREQAWEEAKEGTFEFVKYFCSLLGDFAPPSMTQVANADDAIKLWTGEGLGMFGVLMAGTPDDAIAYIENLQARSGGFGTFLFLAHNCASFDATRRSYELFARYVMPHFQHSNTARYNSLAWVGANAPAFIGGLTQAQEKAVLDYETKK